MFAVSKVLGLIFRVAAWVFCFWICNVCAVVGWVGLVFGGGVPWIVALRVAVWFVLVWILGVVGCCLGVDL